MKDVGISVTNALHFSPGGKKCKSEEKGRAVKEWKARSRQSNLLLDHFISNISQLYENENQQLLDDLNNFIKSRSKGKLGYVPTAHIRLGMNVADNQLLADMIEKSVTKQRVALFVFRLTSEDCSNFSSIKAKLAEGFINEASDSEFVGDEEIDKSHFQDLSYPSLALTRKQLIKDPRPVVVIIDDVENCGNKPGLDSFLISAQQCIENLNIVVVLCCYTGCLTLQQLLSTLSCDTMYLSSFNPRNPRNVFQSIMSKVILTPDVLTFKFSPKCLQLFADNFDFVDISINRISLMIKACLFHHFYSRPLLLSFKDEQSLSEALDSLPKKELNKLIKDISKLSSAKNIGIMSKEAILCRLKEIHSAHLNLLDVCTYLYLLTNDLPGSKLPPTVAGIFISFLEDRNYGISFEVEQTVRALGFLTFDELKRKLEHCSNNCSKTDHSEFSLILEEERETLNGFKDDDLVTKPSQAMPEFEMEPCKTRSEWKEKMKKRIAETPKVLSTFEVWRNNFLSTIKKYLQQVSSPYFMPLRELVYFDDVDYIVEHIFPSARSQMLDDLKHPLGNDKDNDFMITQVYDTIQEGESKLDIGDLLENYKTEREFTSKKKRKGNTEDEESGLEHY